MSVDQEELARAGATPPTPTFDARGRVPRETDDEIDEPTARELDPLALLAEIADPVELPDVVCNNRFRPGWGVRYALTLDGEDIKRWRNRSTLRKGTKREEFDEYKFAGIVLGNLCRAIIHDGVELEVDAEPLTFAHPAVWKNYNAGSVSAAVRAFYGNDPYLGATLDAVLAAAGVGDEVETLDPTRPSSD